MGEKVQGYCPMGCGSTLFLGAGGYITCSWSKCPCPDAASSILEDAETKHVVTLGETDFTIRHPLKERLNDELLQCDLHSFISNLSGPPRRQGTYRVHAGKNHDYQGSYWEAI